MGYNQLRLLLPLLLSAVGLFLSLWIVLPAPNMTLLPLAVGAPEISPWLIGLHSLALLFLALLFPGWRSPVTGFAQLAWVFSLVGLLLSAAPLLQLTSAHQQFTREMEQGLGANYLATVPKERRASLRSQPWQLGTSFAGLEIPEEGVRYRADILFATPNGVPLKLDLYRPANPGKDPIGKDSTGKDPGSKDFTGKDRMGKSPTIILIHGGAWQGGSPKDNPEFNRYMAAQGYTVVAITYRFAPQYPFPAQLEDVKAALAFIQTHAVDYGIDLERMAIMGRSAGAHLAMLAAYQPNALPFRAVINYYGPVDLVKGYQDLPSPNPLNVRRILDALIGGPPDRFLSLYEQASPAYAVRPGLPPTLLVYGGRDHIVEAKFGRYLRDRLRSTNNQAIFLEIPWAEHAFDAVPNGLSSQLSLYHTERFLAWALRGK
jgi:acetyl esterase/lipase